MLAPKHLMLSIYLLVYLDSVCVWSYCALQLNESFKSGHSGIYLIPYEEFYLPELREKVDLRKDFVTWLHASGSTVFRQFVLSLR